MFSKRSAPSTSRRTARVVVVVAGCVAAVLPAAAAQAQPIIDVTPSLAGTTVAVGDVAQGQLTIANHSTPNHDQGFLTVTELTLVPSCGAQFADPSCAFTPPGADPGVISLGDNASGSGACSSNAFTVGPADVLTGKRTLTPGSTVQLSPSGPASTCVVSFTYTVEHVATKDSNNVAGDGMQTDVVGFVKAAASYDSMQTVDSGYATVKVTRDTPELTARASPAVQTGGQLSVAGTIAGTHPDGNVTFDLFGPGDPGCTGAPMATSMVPVNGNGTYPSTPVAASQVGTYRWKASYGGDEDNDAVSSACSAPAAATVVSAASAPPPPPPPPPPAAPGGGGTTPGGGTDAGGSNPGGGTPTNPGNGSKAVPIQRIRLDAFSLSRKTFARASTATALAATAAKATKKKTKTTAKGTTIKYRLSAPATVTIIVERVTKGRRSGAKCVKETKKLKRKKACIRYVKALTIKRVHTSAGAKKVAFSGRAGRKALAAGSYRMRATAAAGVGTTSAARTAKFKIVKR